MKILRLGRRLVRAIGRAACLAYYHAHRLLPRDASLAVFASYWYRGYSCNPAAIFEKARELAPWVRGVWLVDRGHRDRVPAGVPVVVAGTLAYYRALARATWLVNNVNFPDFVVKRAGSIHVQTHHGTPVKVMGVEQARYPANKNADLSGLVRRCRRWDYSISANAHSTEAWRRSYPGTYETLECGYPRNDRLALADPAEVTDLRVRLGIEPHLTVVLYAPTLRDRRRGFRPLLDVEELARALGPDHLVLRRAHYLYAAIAAPIDPRVRDVSRHPTVEDLLLASDVLITDYSSIMFDFGVLDRPIVLFVPDWTYYRRTRGVTFDLIAEPPGVVTRSFQELVDAFLTGAYAGDVAATSRDAFRRRFCYLDDGYAADRVVPRVFGLPVEHVCDAEGPRSTVRTGEGA